MRFEIKAGGGFLILVGLVALSGGVFALGLVAGYEMARQNQPDLNQISSTYPLPTPPEKPAPVAEMSPAAAAPSPAISVASAPAGGPLKHPALPAGEIPPAARPAPPAPAPQVKPPPEAPPASRPPSDEEDTDEDSETASSPAESVKPLPLGARPYNIQIEAVMDKSGADEMVARLKTLGYNASEVKVSLNGQTWYRVHVGPYASADQATAAQDRLREQYKQAYTTSH